MDFQLPAPVIFGIYENQIYTIYNTIQNVGLLSRYKNGGNTQIGIMRETYVTVLKEYMKRLERLQNRKTKETLLPDMFTVIYLK